MDSQFFEHQHTNYVPTAPEIEQLKEIIAKRQVVVDEIDAKLEDLDRLRKELEATKKVHTNYISWHRDLTTSARRLPADILSVIFATFLSLFPPHSSPHPAVTISHVCHAWRSLALELPLLWTQVSISTPRITSQIQQWEDVWVRWVRASCEQAMCFVERAKACPLELSLKAYDPEDGLCDLIPAYSDTAKSLFGPILDTLERCCESAWRSIRVYLRLNQSKSFAIAFAYIPTELPPEGTAVALDIACSNGVPLGDETWAVGGRIDMRSGGFPSLTAKMTPGDFSRIDAKWTSLTTLAIGPPDAVTVFNAQHTLHVLSLTPNLVHVSVELSSGAGFETAIPTRLVQLPKLKSLAISGGLPRAGFSSALVLPSLTRLYAEKIKYCISEDETSSAVLDLVKKYGKQLIEVGLHYQCFVQSALLAALDHIPNVEILRLTTHDQFVNVFDAAERRNNPGVRWPAMVEPIITRFVSKIGGSPTPPTEDYICPRLKELVCGVGELTNEVRNDVLHLIKERRSVGKNGMLTGMQHLMVGFDKEFGVEEFGSELEQKGVDTRGVKFKVRSQTSHTVTTSIEAL